jgi:hypothetical protein
LSAILVGQVSKNIFIVIRSVDVHWEFFMTRFLIKASSFLCLIFAALVLFSSMFPPPPSTNQLGVISTATLAGVFLLAIGKVISLLQGIHLYNQILTEKMAGSELAKYVVYNKLDNGGYTITNKDRERYEKIVYENDLWPEQ